MDYRTHLRVLWNPGWICLASFVGYCTWFLVHNHPCENVAITLPLILAFGLILTPVLLLAKNLFIIVGLNFGAIGGALAFLSFHLLAHPSFQIAFDDEFALKIVVALTIGLTLGAIIGILGGVFVWSVYKWLNRRRSLQKVWTTVVLLFLFSTLPWFYTKSWEAFGYRWIINDLVAKDGDNFIQALRRYDERSDRKHEFAPDSMYVYTYNKNALELWIAQREKSEDKESSWMVVYELQEQDGLWQVSEVYGICGYECQGCYAYRDSYTFY